MRGVEWGLYFINKKLRRWTLSEQEGSCRTSENVQESCKSMRARGKRLVEAQHRAPFRKETCIDKKLNLFLHRKGDSDSARGVDALCFKAILFTVAWGSGKASKCLRIYLLSKMNKQLKKKILRKKDEVRRLSGCMSFLSSWAGGLLTWLLDMKPILFPHRQEVLMSSSKSSRAKNQIVEVSGDTQPTDTNFMKNLIHRKAWYQSGAWYFMSNLNSWKGSGIANKSPNFINLWCFVHC